jgi:protein-tyrosine phosphatase
MATTVPGPRTPGRYAVTVVCTGNICRSPTADVILNAMLADHDLAPVVSVDSSGLGGWHIGQPMDSRSATQLVRLGYDPSRHRARQLPRDWVERYDLVLAMDSGHLRDLRDLARSTGAEPDRVVLFGDFDPVHPGVDVPDPYYGGDHGFREVATLIERTSAELVAVLDGRGGAR